MYVDARHFASERDKKFFDLKNMRPWKIVQNIDKKVYKLNIPQTLKDAGLTLIFHTWKMHLASDNVFPDQILLPGLPIEISAKNDKDKTHKKWEVLKVVNCHQTKQYQV